MGTEPVENEIPPEMEEFPFELQEAFKVFFRLPDRYDSMSGTILGKDLSVLGSLFDIYNVLDRETALDYITVMNIVRTNILADQKKAEQSIKTPKVG
jgi:hypothetical protein